MANKVKVEAHEGSIGMGSIWQNEKDVFELVAVGNKQVLLVTLPDGSHWGSSVPVANTHRLTIEEWAEVRHNDDNFTRIRGRIVIEAE